MSTPSASASATDSHLPGRVGIVISSTRPTRICPDVARWTLATITEGSQLRYGLIDLADVDLPLLDEPLKAALQDYRHEHTKRWSALVQGLDGLIFVAPQYNWGYPAVLKNALDYLYVEWRDKPVTTVTYGTRGGGKGADQLAGVFAGLHMRPIEHRLQVKITDADVDADWQIVDVDALMSPYRPQLKLIDEQMTAALQDGDDPADG